MKQIWHNHALTIQNKLQTSFQTAVSLLKTSYLFLQSWGSICINYYVSVHQEKKSSFLTSVSWHHFLSLSSSSQGQLYGKTSHIHTMKVQYLWLNWVTYAVRHNRRNQMSIPSPTALKIMQLKSEKDVSFPNITSQSKSTPKMSISWRWKPNATFYNISRFQATSRDVINQA